MKTCGQMLIELLEHYGVDMVFGIPGVHTVELYRGLAASSIRHITPRHEQGAGFMADGYTRVSGKPGVCLIITGPGMTNITTAMGQAYGDSIPMLVISSVNRRAELGSGGGHLHELPSQRNLVAGVAAFSHTLMTPDQLPEVLARAFAIFGSARPRPVHIEIPIDVITAPARHDLSRTVSLASPPGPDPEAIARAVASLMRAQRPVVLLGGGALNAASEVRALVERLDAPVTVTMTAKGILPKGHPLLLGNCQTLEVVRQLIVDSDLVLAIGTELGATDYDVYSNGGFSIAAPLIRIDIDGEQLMRNALPDIAIRSDARLAVQALLQALGPAAQTCDAGSPGGQRAAAVHARLAADWKVAPYPAYAHFLETIAEALPGVVIVGDSTQPVYFGTFLFNPDQPRSWFNSASGYGTLGYALPAAIGAKLGAPQRPVVCLVGDGGIQFTIGELAAAMEAQTPIIVLVWNNRGYGEIKRYMTERGIEPVGVDIYTPDFQTIARGFGWLAMQAGNPEELRIGLHQAQCSGKPVLIEIPEASMLQGVVAR